MTLVSRPPTLPHRVRPARLVRALHLSLDAYRIWHKITFARGRILATEGEGWQSLDDPAWLSDPALFYRNGHAPPAVERKVVGRFAGAEVTRFTFPTLHPLRFPETNVAMGRLYRQPGAGASPGGGGSPVVMISHGWAHRSLRAVEHLYVRPLLKAGFSVAFVLHPLHFERTPRGAYSGEWVISADVVLTVEAFRQGVVDLVAAADWLRSEGLGPVGLFGYSLGGYLAGIMAALRDDWAFVVLGGAGDSPVSPILDTALGKNLREDLKACGMLDRDRLTRAWSVISPGSLKPRVPGERILLVAGRFDRIMLPQSVRRLWSAWGRPRLCWLNRGHYTLLATNRGLMSLAIPFMQEMSRRPASGSRGGERA